MKDIFFHIAFVCFLLTGWPPTATGQPAGVSQNRFPVRIYIGPELNMANNIQVPEIFGHDERGFYAYSFDYREAIEFLDTEFRTIRRKHLEIHNRLRDRTLLALFHFHDSIYMFTSEQRFKRMLLYVETIDKETLLQNGDERLIMDIQNLGGWGAEFGFQLSRLESKLLVISKLDVLNKNIQDLHMEMYGPGLTLEWEADERIIYPKRPPRKSVIKVSENGDVFIIGLQDDQTLKSLRSMTKNRYNLVAVTDHGKYSNSYLLNLPGLYIRGVQVEPGGSHDASLVGFYSPTFFRSFVDGVFYIEIDNENQAFRNQKLYEFEPYFLSEAIAGVQKKEPEEMFSFIDRHLIRRRNGDLIFLAENEFEQTYDTYQNIIVASFTPGGNLNWKRVIPKRQDIDPTVPFNYSSFSVHAPWNMDKIFLVYNDDNKNPNWPNEDEIKTFHPGDKANLRVIGIGPSGELSNNTIYKKSRRRMKTPIPLQYYNMLNSEMVIPALRYKRYNYFRIGFSE